jgi:hypothetical protein
MHSSGTYIDFLENFRQPVQSPFESDGKTDSGDCFIYLTNRTQAFSYLFPAEKYSAILGEAYKKIDMGYTQLWIFEKRYAVKPDSAAIGNKDFVTETIFNKDYPAEIERKNWANKLYVVLKSPEFPGENIVSYHTDENSAVESADHYCAINHIPMVVGLMKADLYWH